MPHKLIKEDADFRDFLLKVNEAQELEMSARKMLKRILASFESVDELGLHVNWLTLMDAKSGVSVAYKKNDLEKEDVIRTAKLTYLRQSQFMMVLAYEAFEAFVESICTRLAIYQKGNFRFFENFEILRKKFPILTELKLPSGHVGYHCSEVGHNFYFWEFVYIVRDLRQVIVHEHGCVESFDHRFRKLEGVINIKNRCDEEKWFFLKNIYAEFFNKQSGRYYVWTLIEDGFDKSNLFLFIVERLKSYAYFMAQTCIVDTDRK